MGGGGSEVGNLPVFDLGAFLDKCITNGGEPDEELKKQCVELAQCLKDTSALVVRDPRCPSHDNATFLNMLEKYYAQPLEVKKPDERPHFHYQVGVTPEGVEVPRCSMDPACLKEIEEQAEENKATVPKGADPKWRFMHRVGPRPTETKFKELNAEPVYPKDFPEWEDTMTMWGKKMLQALEVVAEMAAIGLGLDRKAFVDKMKNAPHLLAPTGSDLAKYTDVGTVFAGYHYDLNFLTIHGKSRYPGLFIWLRDGTKTPVKMPEGCLLLQAGKQLEWLTGGEIMAGMHEVIISDKTKEAAAKAKEDGRSLWRVSSTVFGHIASDATLEPLGRFSNEETCKKYRKCCAGEQVQEELDTIKLKPNGLA
mmetsp:Transcript_13059/g.27551  ORF Transcript_13059/g.27551 Transcript_13059/m.27551 type:complete len:366 (+) Transcript_13059:133-1230(+)